MRAVSLLLAVCAVVIDVALAVALTLGIVEIGGSTAAPLAALAGLAALAVDAWALMSFGMSLGWMLAGLRLITAESGSAPGLGGHGTWTIADVRRDGDPITPSAVVPDLSAAMPQTYRVPVAPTAPNRANDSAGATLMAASPASVAPAAPAGAPAATPAAPKAEARPEPRASDETMMYRAKLRTGTGVIVIDGDRSVIVTPRMMIGRNPTVVEGEIAVAIPDISRDLSKNHVRIHQDADGRLFATDLASTNGTRLRSADGTETRLPPQVSTPVGWGDTLQLGTQHSVRFEPRVKAGGGEAPNE